MKYSLPERTERSPEPQARRPEGSGLRSEGLAEKDLLEAAAGAAGRVDEPDLDVGMPPTHAVRIR
jgi:hypothetical protein